MSEDASLHLKCLNCGSAVENSFCQKCGQRVRDNTDRSLGRLLGEFLGNIFFLDNRFFISLWYLIRFPGRMTVEFLQGKRKKFISPVTLFLFFNLIYFFLSPLSDYSLSFYDQMYYQPYSAWFQETVRTKLDVLGLTEQQYDPIYQRMSDSVSKSIMIINIPMIAGFVFLMSFKRREFYFDSLIYSFHFFTLFMLSWISLDCVGKLLTLLSTEEDSILATITFNFFTFIGPAIYGMISMHKFLGIRWYWFIPAGLGTLAGVLLSNFIYRFVIFLLTIWLT
ncbi:MAG: DUF3667 domain-containing protein [Bacteroidota bacterium]